MAFSPVAKIQAFMACYTNSRIVEENILSKTRSNKIKGLKTVSKS
jgi:hypothetical protein